MATPVSDCRTEREQIERWRTDELERAGYEHEAAVVLAICDDVDLHEAVGLLERGCTQELALQILL
jgi:hypothetical protein